MLRTKPFKFAVLLSVISAGASAQMNIIPAPLRVKNETGHFSITESTKIHSTPEFKEVAELFAEQASFKNRKIIAGAVQPALSIRFMAAKPTDSLGEEGYILNIGTMEVSIKAAKPQGAFYATQSLLQLITTDHKIPCGQVYDKPRFKYRGLHLDVSRNFYPVAFVKRYIDLMARYKLNTFHWHLTDDSGWRLEIKAYPRLTQNAAWREGKNWKDWRAQGEKFSEAGNPNAYGGFYTQEEARDVVKYAASRGVTVIPEIEMPGHSYEVLSAYPELSCSGKENNKESDYNVAKPEVYTFLQNVLTEVMDVFPSRYIHIGGDEAGKAAWKTDPLCLELMKKEGFTDVEQLQSYFVKRIEKFIVSKGRKMIGWDEILQGGLAPEATVMSWRGVQGGIDAAKMGHDVVMTPAAFVYFDYYQGDPKTEPEAIGGFVPVEKVYSYEPIPAELSSEQGKSVLGAQANLWTEYITTSEHVEYMEYPRAIALAEVTWSSKQNRNWNDFQRRMQHQYGYLQRLNVNYARPSYQVTIVPEFIYQENKAMVSILSQQDNATIYYTTDGSLPTVNSKHYQGPFEVRGSQVVTAAVFAKGDLKGKPVTLPIDFHKAIGKKVIYNLPFSKNYQAKKENTLTDGYRGGISYGDGVWQGIETNDLDVTVDMGASVDLSALSVGFMQLISQGIYLPSYVKVLISDNGTDFKEVGLLNNEVPDTESQLLTKDFKFDLKGKKGRYVRIVAQDKQKGYLFVDEVIVY